MSIIDRESLLVGLRQHAIQIRPKGQEVVLTSGRKSRVYCDVRRVMLKRHLIGPTANLLCDEIEELEKGGVRSVGTVAGVAVSGCHLASIVGLREHLDVIYVRKEAKKHGTSNLLEIPEGVRTDMGVVLLEDVVTTGGSSLQAVEVLRAAGLSVFCVIAIVDRRPSPYMGGRLASVAEEDMTTEDLRRSVPFRSLFRIEELVENFAELEHD